MMNQIQTLPPWGNWENLFGIESIENFDEIYETIIKAAVLYEEIKKDYENLDDDVREEAEDGDPRTDQWLDLMKKAESLLDENIDEACLSAVDPDCTRELLLALLKDSRDD